jgi:hypothetical protein
MFATMLLRYYWYMLSIWYMVWNLKKIFMHVLVYSKGVFYVFFALHTFIYINPKRYEIMKLKLYT